MIYPNQDRSFKGKQYNRKSSIQIRLLRVDLPGGEREVLITTLLNSQKYLTKIFKELYFMTLGVNYIATNYLLVQRIIERLTGQPFESHIRMTQWEPAGLRKTVYGNSGDVVPQKSPTYSYYQLDKDKGERIQTKTLRQVNEHFPVSYRADAGVFSTAIEMAHWLLTLENGKLLKPQSIKAMWTPVKLNNGKYDGFDLPYNAYALGWPVAVRKKHPAVAPMGGGRAFILDYPNDDLSVILFTNFTGCSPGGIAEKIAAIYLNSR